MAEVRTDVPECFVEAIDSKRGTDNFINPELIGRVIFEGADDGVQLIRCTVEGCRAVATVNREPSDLDEAWEDLEKTYAMAVDACAKGGQ